MKVGDYVRIKNPRHVGKGEVRYSKIMEVVKVNGSCGNGTCLILSNVQQLMYLTR